MKSRYLMVLGLALGGCTGAETIPNDVAPITADKSAAPSLAEARRGFKTVLKASASEKTPVETAPAAIFRTVKYPAAPGALAAYATPDPKDGKKHPALVWITGGDCNSIGDVWSPAPPENDQTAAAFRKAGVVMMFPSLRGGNDNPGRKEGFLGEVDDVLAAAKWLETQPYVDPKRIYLGGHSTGGTLVLLTAAASPRFRAVFSFGPVADVSGYGDDSGFLPFDINNSREIEMRSPGSHLEAVKSPTWVIEGDSTTGASNIDQLRAMEKSTKNPQLHFVGVRGFDHFSVLAPVTTLLARKILQDNGAQTNLALSETEIK